MDEQRFGERLRTALDDPDRERAFRELARLYADGDEGQRSRIRAWWDFGRKWRLPDLGDLARRLGRDPPERRIRLWLLYQSIENARIDFRDNLIGIAVIYHAVLAIGLDPGEVFEEVAAISADPMAGILREFLLRSERNRSLEAFGYLRTQTPEGPRFEPDRKFWPGSRR